MDAIQTTEARISREELNRRLEEMDVTPDAMLTSDEFIAIAFGGHGGSMDETLYIENLAGEAEYLNSLES